MTSACELANALLIIRQARLGDFKPMLEIEQEAFGRHALDPSTLFWLLLRRWHGLLTAERDGVLVGYVITRIANIPWAAKRGGISSIAVHKYCRHQGVGRKLMEAALEFMRQIKVKHVDLEVSITNGPALALYRELGFVPLKPLPDYYGPGEDGMRMTLELSASAASREELSYGRKGYVTGGQSILSEGKEMTDCIFCKVASGEIDSKKIYEDQDMVAFHDINKKAPVHIVIIPRKHITNLLEMTTEDEPLIGKVIAVGTELAKEQGIAESGFRLVFNCNRDAGQSVDHIHLHLLGGRPLGWPPG